MVHLIQLALGAFMSSLSINGLTKSWEAHGHDQQFGDNESTHNGKGQTLWKEGIAQISKVSAMTPGSRKIIEKVHISRYFDSLETDLDIEANACCVDCTDTWPLKRVHWVSQSSSRYPSTANYACTPTVEFDSGVAWTSLPVMRTHPRVAHASKRQWLPATLYNTGWMDYRQVHHGSFKAIPILDSVDVEMVYGYCVLHYHFVQWYVRSYGWRYRSLS